MSRYVIGIDVDLQSLEIASQNAENLEVLYWPFSEPKFDFVHME